MLLVLLLLLLLRAAAREARMEGPVELSTLPDGSLGSLRRAEPAALAELAVRRGAAAHGPDTHKACEQVVRLSYQHASDSAQKAGASKARRGPGTRDERVFGPDDYQKTLLLFTRWSADRCSDTYLLRCAFGAPVLAVEHACLGGGGATTAEQALGGGAEARFAPGTTPFDPTAGEGHESLRAEMTREAPAAFDMRGKVAVPMFSRKGFEQLKLPTAGAFTLEILASSNAAAALQRDVQYGRQRRAALESTLGKLRARMAHMQRQVQLLRTQYEDARKAVLAAEANLAAARKRGAAGTLGSLEQELLQARAREQEVLREQDVLEMDASSLASDASIASTSVATEASGMSLGMREKLEALRRQLQESFAQQLAQETEDQEHRLLRAVSRAERAEAARAELAERLGAAAGYASDLEGELEAAREALAEERLAKRGLAEQLETERAAREDAEERLARLEAKEPRPKRSAPVPGGEEDLREPARQDEARRASRLQARSEALGVQLAELGAAFDELGDELTETMEKKLQLERKQQKLEAELEEARLLLGRQDARQLVLEQLQQAVEAASGQLARDPRGVGEQLRVALAASRAD